MLYSTETDPVNVDRKVQLDERILRLDNLIVEISNKRRVTPAQLSLQLAKLLKLKRKASVSIMCFNDFCYFCKITTRLNKILTNFRIVSDSFPNVKGIDAIRTWPT